MHIFPAPSSTELRGAANPAPDERAAIVAALGLTADGPHPTDAPRIAAPGAPRMPRWSATDAEATNCERASSGKFSLRVKVRPEPDKAHKLAYDIREAAPDQPSWAFRAAVSRPGKAFTHLNVRNPVGFPNRVSAAVS
ncbi:hypothetical protein [Streptomyces flavofungini]|uniref:hypothetical protein n=1 Tax=Streptomyces flavofungini TaxID=68200 RepID=UPI0025AFCC43|nr:hypothetical protein [Streptomyces flavofungini]WJV50880.1 hypothetical protein QUY26_38460 [Streptomyces flavofungini]